MKKILLILLLFFFLFLVLDNGIQTATSAHAGLKGDARTHESRTQKGAKQ